MKKKFKSLLVVIMTMAIALSGVFTAGLGVTSAAIEPVELTEEKVFELKPGEVNQIKLPVISTGLYIYNPKITISCSVSDAPFTFSKPKLYVGTLEVNNIGTGLATDVVFDVTVKDTAEIGTYPIEVKFDFETWDLDNGNLIEDTATVYTNIIINEEKIPTKLTVSNVYLSSSNIGSDAELSFTVKNEGEILAKNVYMRLVFEEDNKKYIEERYTVKEIKLGDMAEGDNKSITLPIKILSNIDTGRKIVTANFTFKTPDGSKVESTYDFSINLTDVVNAAKLPKLIITDLSYDSDLEPGDEFVLNVELKNIGDATAENVELAVDEASTSATGIIKNYYMDSIAAKDIDKNDTVTVKLPLKVAKGSTGGLIPVKLVVTYMDKDDASFSFDETVYIDVMVKEAETGEQPNLIISNVKQNPAKPSAGGNVEISFDLENKSKVDAKGLMVSVEGYSDSTFIPVNSDPYQYFEMLKGGEKIRVTIPLLISNQIPEGLNTLTVNVAYDGGKGVSYTIPVKNIQNDADGVSKPVLLITNYSADKDELEAGSLFNLTFDVYNTNTSTAARNIKLEIVLDNSNTFTLTQGNNTFYISKLAPEESVTFTLPLKIKSTATTGGYPITFKLNYEYDGYVPDKENPDNGSSITIQLPVKENLRPKVDNVYVYSWDGPIYMGSPATLHLDFYNMGYSPLNNVTVSVDGDFTKADGSMYFIGNVMNGSSAYADFDVIPNVVGSAKCILRINYEDSNGDIQEYVYEYTTDIMDPSAMPMPDNGGSTDGEVFNPGGVVTKKDILPLWAFIAIQCAIFILFIPITRKVIISIYKARLLKKEQEY